MDMYVWEHEIDGKLSVLSLRLYLDDNMLEAGSMSTIWNKLIPRKINILLCQVSIEVSMDRISRLNLRNKGLVLESILSPVCSSADESTERLFFSCPIAKSIWEKIVHRWQIPLPSTMLVAMFLSWANKVTLGVDDKKNLDAVVGVGV